MRLILQIMFINNYLIGNALALVLRPDCYEAKWQGRLSRVAASDQIQRSEALERGLALQYKSGSEQKERAKNVS
jgi:hypothetical protein